MGSRGTRTNCENVNGTNGRSYVTWTGNNSIVKPSPNFKWEEKNPKFSNPMIAMHIHTLYALVIWAEEWRIEPDALKFLCIKNTQNYAYRTFFRSRWIVSAFRLFHLFHFSLSLECNCENSFNWSTYGLFGNSCFIFGPLTVLHNQQKRPCAIHFFHFF